MTPYTLDDLVKALELRLGRSRKKLDHMQAKRLASVITMDRTGQPESMSLECRLPAGDGSEFNFELLRLPWSGLNPTDMVDICSVSVEIDCDIRKSPRKSRQHHLEYDYTATPVTGHAKGKNTHKILVDFSRNHPETSVSIDGLSVEEFMDQKLAADLSQPGRKKRRFKTAMIILVSLGIIAAAAYLFLVPY